MNSTYCPPVPVLYFTVNEGTKEEGGLSIWSNRFTDTVVQYTQYSITTVRVPTDRSGDGILHELFCILRCSTVQYYGQL